ncbi:MRA1 NEP1 like pre-rRNA adjacent protein [Cryptosporidium ubiquitum]|uniref:MRA1 NEP1 like pre-rRNA adjacent protein n=1 Tax=Cryptosporidium ubiquitum TaxID=857276 RepID=A0A1J4MCZ7_9CRYT|nr:MRA1 NEP1 like pre-rRNA adjacent protein [Cryptosporidium ubiquitum]OII72112.1 MRA1 NEP1 like pre-rRNA adjacent protein [Cryptosporidium ubiquitum]
MNSNVIYVPKDLSEWKNEERVFILLDRACLELYEKKDKSLELLNGIDHPKKKIEEYCSSHFSEIFSKEEMVLNIRPDILHQCLLSLLDSPLNKSGRLLVYIRTMSNVLIEVNPQLSVPRSFKEFSSLMVNLLVKRKVLAVNGNTILMKIIKNDIDKILPIGGKKYGLSVNGTQKSIRALANEIYSGQDSNARKSAVTFVVGAVAYGDPIQSCDFIEEVISISSYPLSAALCCSKICNEFEYLWGIC